MVTTFLKCQFTTEEKVFHIFKSFYDINSHCMIKLGNKMTHEPKASLRYPNLIHKGRTSRETHIYKAYITWGENFHALSLRIRSF